MSERRSFMSGASPPPDNSMQVESMRQQAAKEERERQDKLAAEHKAELAGLRTSARTGAGGTVRNYFSEAGIDPDRYAGSIDTQLNNILSGISPTDENPGAAFTGAGQSIYDTLQTGERSKYGNQLNQLFAPEWEMRRVGQTFDDPYLAGVEGEQYADADKIIKDMLERGVLTDTGYASAQKDLEGQRAGVRSRLNEIGTGLITKEQQDLRDISNRAKQSASTMQLGSSFDPYSYQTEADADFNDFIATLGDNIRAQVPGALFNTAGLAAIGGAGQGLGNTAFNPAAAQGQADEEDDDQTDRNPNSIF
jgi:hypothetical protein